MVRHFCKLLGDPLHNKVSNFLISDDLPGSWKMVLHCSTYLQFTKYKWKCHLFICLNANFIFVHFTHFLLGLLVFYFLLCRICTCMYTRLKTTELHTVSGWDFWNVYMYLWEFALCCLMHYKYFPQFFFLLICLEHIFLRKSQIFMLQNPSGFLCQFFNGLVVFFHVLK